MKNKIITSAGFFLLSIWLSPFLFSQDRGMLAKNAPGKTAVQLKWFNDNYTTPVQLNIYRAEGNSQDFVKINSSPITLTDVSLKNDEAAIDLKSFLKIQNSKDSLAMALSKSFFFINVIKSNTLAGYLACYYEDVTVEKGKTYSYKVKKIVNGSDQEYAASAPLLVGELIKQVGPVGLKSEAGDQEVKLKWKTDSASFLYNVFRSSTSSSQGFIQLSPVINKAFIAGGIKSEYLFTDSDSNLVNGKTYYYKVNAVDALGNESEFSLVVSAIPVDQTPPLCVDALNAEPMKDHVHLSWIASASPDCKGYTVYRSDTYFENYKAISTSSIASKVTSFDDKVSIQGKAFYYEVESEDQNGNKSRSQVAVCSIPDDSPPAMPANLSARSESGKIILNWNKNNETDLQGYHVFRAAKNEEGNFNLLTPFPIKENSFSDTLQKEARNFFVYKICAVDLSWNRSPETKPIFARMPDVMPPSPPLIKNISEKNNVIRIAWIKVADPDLMSYELLRKSESGSFQKWNKKNLTPADTLFADDEPQSGKTNYYSLIAIDSSGNRSAQSAIRSCYFSGGGALILPTNISCIYDPAQNQVKLSWRAIVQPANFAGYYVTRKEEGMNYLPASIAFNGTEFEDKFAEKGKKYSYKINVMDKSGEIVEAREEKMVEVK